MRDSIGCRVNVILALAGSRVGQIPLGRFQAMTAIVKSKLVPDPIRCFVRLVESFSLPDFAEFAASARSEGLLVISGGLVTPEDEVRVSELAKQLLESACKAEIPIALVGILPQGRSRPEVLPMELDCLVCDGDSVDEEITEAVRQLAPRLWLTLPTYDVVSAREGAELDSEVVIDFPHDLDDFRAILMLRFEIYRVLGYLPPAILAAKSELDLDAFDSNAIHLLARDTTSGEIVGCARLIVPDSMWSVAQRQPMSCSAEVAAWCKSLADKERGSVYRKILDRGPGLMALPAASMAAYRSLRTTSPDLRAQDCCELSRLIVAPKARGQGLSRRLTEAATQIARGWLQRTIMIVECREHHRSLYQHFGFQMPNDTHAESAGLLRAQAIAMWQTLKSDDKSPRQPNAHVVLSSLAKSVGEQDALTGQLRRALPAEAWIWSRNPSFTDKSAVAAFDLSLHNHGLACATVQGLMDLLKQSSKCVSICNKRGDSVEISRAASADVPATPIVEQLLKLLDSRSNHA